MSRDRSCFWKTFVTEVVALVEQVTFSVQRAEDFLWSLRSPGSRDPSPILQERVTGILNRVRTMGDKALLEFSRWLDGVDLSASQLRVSQEEIDDAHTLIRERELAALEVIATRLRTVARAILDRLSFSTTLDGTRIETKFRPLAEVGCYVPGGTAAYPSSLLMCAVPAQVAGVGRIVVCTPPKPEGVSPLTLVAADLCGVEEVYLVGGAQAIAAMAYGTESIPPVQKIVGPGNAYVALAKRMVSSHTLIDIPAGPSELLVIADASASPRSIALDMVSQAEHGPDAVTVLLSDSRELCEQVVDQLSSLFADCPRQEVVAESLAAKGGVFHCDSLEECISLANEFAPEHVQVMTVDARSLAERLISAGLVLLGPYTPVAASDYGLGVNHVLPTKGFAKTHSGLSVLDFVRLVHVVETDRESLQRVADTLVTLAEAEGLWNHARAVQGRFEE